MAITMQGSWTVSVKSVEGFEPAQRFIISGAATGNGTYTGALATPPVHVTGASWIITVQIQEGGTWVTEHDRITFPTMSGGHYRFDIEANEPDDDPVWDDIILTCTRPTSGDAYLIYGSVSYYSDTCLFNPCNLRWPVIETQAALTAALQNPLFRVPLSKLYPDRMKPVPRLPPGPTPDPPPFVPLVLPLENGALPAKEGEVLQRVAAPAAAPKAKAANAAAADAVPQTTMLRTITATQPRTTIDIDAASIASVIGRYTLRCQTGALPGVSLRFQEYDRTAAELLGGAYTGTGPRENLGGCTTDANGNYIFLFTRSFGSALNEIFNDTAAGEDVFTQWYPDIIAQLMAFSPSQPAGYSYETAPYWNIPHLKRINICVPASVAPLPHACQEGRAIQYIGNIQVGGSNHFDADGRITTHSIALNTPQVRCAAWAGYLDLYACFLDHPDVTQYTIRYRRSPSEPWIFFQESYLYPKIGYHPDPYSGELIGPFDRILTVDGVAGTPAKAYNNIENDSTYVVAHRTCKATISSWKYPLPQVTPLGARQFGSVTFFIEGYNAAGHRVAGAEDQITLYIDNDGPNYDIDSVTMGAQLGGDCALFNLGGLANPPMTVKFRALQIEGFLGSYALTVRKGNIGGFAINGPSYLSGTYAHGADDPCNSFEGTFDVISHDAQGYVTADITASSGHWLDPGIPGDPAHPPQPFCTFAVQVSCSTRVTNGYTAGGSYGPNEYLLGIQAS